MKNYKVSGMKGQSCVDALHKAMTNKGIAQSAVSLVEGEGHLRVPDEAAEAMVKTIVEGAGFSFGGPL